MLSIINITYLQRQYVIYGDDIGTPVASSSAVTSSGLNLPLHHDNRLPPVCYANEDEIQYLNLLESIISLASNIIL